MFSLLFGLWEYVFRAEELHILMLGATNCMIPEGTRNLCLIRLPETLCDPCLPHFMDAHKLCSTVRVQHPWTACMRTRFAGVCSQC